MVGAVVVVVAVAEVVVVVVGVGEGGRAGRRKWNGMHFPHLLQLESV